MGHVCIIESRRVCKQVGVGRVLHDNLTAKVFHRALAIRIRQQCLNFAVNFGRTCEPAILSNILELLVCKVGEQRPIILFCSFIVLVLQHLPNECPLNSETYCVADIDT